MKKQLKVYLSNAEGKTFLHVQPIHSKICAALACQEAYEQGWMINKAYYCLGSVSFPISLPEYFKQRSQKIEKTNRISIVEEWVKMGLPKEKLYELLDRVGMLHPSIGLY